MTQQHNAAPVSAQEDRMSETMAMTPSEPTAEMGQRARKAYVARRGLVGNDARAVLAGACDSDPFIEAYALGLADQHAHTLARLAAPDAVAAVGRGLMAAYSGKPVTPEEWAACDADPEMACSMQGYREEATAAIRALAAHMQEPTDAA